MLQFRLENKNTYTIHFDVPIGTDIAKNEEMADLLALFAEDDGHVVVYDMHGSITGIRGEMASLAKLIDSCLPAEQAAVQKMIISHMKPDQSAHEKEGLQVNFHQNSFDTEERYWLFILNQGHFIDYFFNRINWIIAPQNELVTPFPLHVDIESASTCNMNCPMCYRDELKETGQMDFDLFKKAVDECQENNVFSVRLSWRGETLTHPRIKEMISYATARIKNVSFLTNAFYIDDAMIDCFIDCGLSYVAVSFDGIGKVYESIRHPAKFAENYQRLAELRDKKREKGSLLPQVRLCTIWPAIKADPAAYTETMSEVSDYMVCNPYINFKGVMKVKEDFICQYPWERMMVGFDGQVQCCTGWNASDIILGNLQTSTIKDMWHSELMGKIRRVHAGGQRMELESCAACRHGSESETDMDIWDIVKRRY